MGENEDRGLVQCCGYPVYQYPKSIIVHQVIGENDVQKSIDLAVRVPRKKPAIEQVVDVFVKKLKITSVEVLTDKVIVRGHFEIKVLYVACLPNQPVHAIEVRRVRFTTDICIPGARCGMETDVSAAVEYVDYECDKRSRAHWYKNHDTCEETCSCKLHCTRRCSVFIVLLIRAKVLSDREIVFCPTLPVQPMPLKPKG